MTKATPALNPKLAPNPNNPRTITPERLSMLEKAMLEFGDLSGIIFNAKTKQLVSGHQRSKILGEDAQVVIEQRFKKPTKVGTTAIGHVLVNGERFLYREVFWTPNKEKAAAMAANRTAGDWDKAKLTEWIADLKLDESFDLGLTMFDEGEFERMFPPPVDEGEKEKSPKEKSGRSASDDVKTVHLTFTDDTAQEFSELIEHFQRELNINNVTDTVLEVLRAAR